MTAAEFAGPGWVLRLPEGWRGETSGLLVSLRPPDDAGLATISTFRRAGRNFRDDDLRLHCRRMADNLPPAQAESMRHSNIRDVGQFLGFHVEYEAGPAHWSVWFLRAGTMMLQVSFTCPKRMEGPLMADLRHILDSLAGHTDPV